MQDWKKVSNDMWCSAMTALAGMMHELELLLAAGADGASWLEGCSPSWNCTQAQ